MCWMEFLPKFNSRNKFRNKFRTLVDITKDNIYMLMISETKMDDRFSTPYGLGRSSNGGEIFIYVREDIATK